MQGEDNMAKNLKWKPVNWELGRIIVYEIQVPGITVSFYLYKNDPEDKLSTWNVSIASWRSDPIKGSPWKDPVIHGAAAIIGTVEPKTKNIREIKAKASGFITKFLNRIIYSLGDK